MSSRPGRLTDLFQKATWAKALYGRAYIGIRVGVESLHPLLMDGKWVDTLQLGPASKTTRAQDQGGKGRKKKEYMWSLLGSRLLETHSRGSIASAWASRNPSRPCLQCYWQNRPNALLGQIGIEEDCIAGRIDRYFA